MSTTPEGGARSMGEIQDTFAQMLTGAEELPGRDSSKEEPPLMDSSEAEQPDAELADDLVVDDLEADEPDDEQSEDDGETYSIKVDGEDLEVSLAELVNGYQRQSTFTQRQQELAKDRESLDEQLRGVPAQQEALRQTYHEYQEVLQQLRGQMEAANAPADLDWNALERENPLQWLKLKELERQRGAELQAVMTEQGRMQQILQYENDRKLQTHLAHERTRVIEKIPEWSDGEVQASEQRRLVTFGKSVGYSDDELNTLYDHRALVVLRDAMRYRELTGAGKITAAKSKIGSVKGGNQQTVHQTRTRKSKEKRARLRATGKVDDAAAIFADIFAE